MIIILFVCIIIPLSLGLFFMQGRAREMTLFMEIGIFVCLLAAYINGFLASVIDMTRSDLTYFLTPFTEEVLKALPIVFFVFLFRPEKSRIINNAIMVGIGFAILENAYLMASAAGDVTISWAFIRGLGAGMMHGICTLIVGCGLTFVYVRRKLSIVGTYALLIGAIVYHASYNLLIQSSYRIFGILIPIATVIPACLLLNSQKKRAKK